MKANQGNNYVSQAYFRVITVLVLLAVLIFESSSCLRKPAKSAEEYNKMKTELQKTRRGDLIRYSDGALVMVTRRSKATRSAFDEDSLYVIDAEGFGSWWTIKNVAWHDIQEVIKTDDTRYCQEIAEFNTQGQK